MKLKNIGEDTTLTLTTHDRTGQPCIMKVKLSECERCPECQRNQPAKNMAFHMAYQHRRN